VPPGTKFGGKETEPGPEPGGGTWSGGVEFRTATPDLSHVVLLSPQNAIRTISRLLHTGK